MFDTVKYLLQLLHRIFATMGDEKCMGNSCAKNQDQGSWAEAPFQLLPVLVSS